VRSKVKTVGPKPARSRVARWGTAAAAAALTAVPELHKKWQPAAIGTGSHPVATAFDPAPLTECEENHLVAEDAS
jgi:hypothetical protein